MKEQQFKIPGYEYQERNVGTPLTDGAELDLHLANPDLKTLAEVAMGTALNTMPEKPQLGLFEQDPINSLDEARLTSRKIESMRRAEAAGIVEIDTIAIGAMAHMTQDKFVQAA